MRQRRPAARAELAVVRILLATLRAEHARHRAVPLSMSRSPAGGPVSPTVNQRFRETRNLDGGLDPVNRIVHTVPDRTNAEPQVKPKCTCTCLRRLGEAAVRTGIEKAGQVRIAGSDLVQPTLAVRVLVDQVGA